MREIRSDGNAYDGDREACEQGDLEETYGDCIVTPLAGPPPTIANLTARITELETENQRLRELVEELSSAAKAYGEAMYYESEEEVEDTIPRLIAAIETADAFTKGTTDAPKT